MKGKTMKGKIDTKWVCWGLATYSVLSLLSMATMSIGVAVLIVSIALGFKSPGRFFDFFRATVHPKNPFIYRFLLLSLTLAAACILSLVFAYVNPLTYAGRGFDIRFVDFLKLWYLFFPLFLVTLLSILSEKEKKIVLTSWLGTFSVLVLIGLAQFFTGWPRPQPIPNQDGFFHVTLFMGHHLSIASTLIFPCFAALDLAKSRKEWLLWGIAILGLVVLFLTYSRMLWIALPIGVVCWVLLQFSRKWSAGVILGMILFGFVVYQSPDIQKRIYSGMGQSERIRLWEMNLEFFKNRPLLGVGFRKGGDVGHNYVAEKYPGQSVFMGHAHNNFLEMLAGTGVIGFVAWMAWNVGIFMLLFAVWKGTSIPLSFPVGLLVAWIVFHLNGLTQVNFWEGKVMHQMMWPLGWALLWSLEIKSKQKKRRA